MTMAEAAYVYTVKNTVECHKPIIYSQHEPQKYCSIKSVHYFNSIQSGHATKQSHKLINNGLNDRIYGIQFVINQFTEKFFQFGFLPFTEK